MRAAANPPVPAGVRTTTMTRLLAIARNAFVEVIRQPIFGLIIVLTMAALVLDVPLSSWTMGGETAEYKKTDQQLLINLGLSTLLMSGLFVSAFGAAGVVSREIRDRTILTVVAKPLPRGTVVIGKYLGVAGAVAAAYWLCSLVFLMTVRHGVMPTATDRVDLPVILIGCAGVAVTLAAAAFGNYFFRWHFISSAAVLGLVVMTAAMGVIAVVGKNWQLVRFGEGLPWPLPRAMLLLLFSHLVFAAVAVAASTRLGQATTLMACLGFFLLGIWGAYLFAVLGDPGSPVRALVPDLKFFYVLDALVQDKPVATDYVALAAAYAGCLIVAILAVGVGLFQTRELEETASGAPLGVSVVALLGRMQAAGLLLSAVIIAWRRPGALGWLLAAALAAGGVLGWLYWGWFGRGVKWTYFVQLALAAGGLVLSGLRLLGVRLVRGAEVGRPALVAGLVVCGVVMLILLLPKARHHFNLIRGSRTAASAA